MSPLILKMSPAIVEMLRPSRTGSELGGGLDEETPLITEVSELPFSWDMVGNTKIQRQFSIRLNTSEFTSIELLQKLKSIK